jgi:quercetin dioxygenase-like cupin family protein
MTEKLIFNLYKGGDLREIMDGGGTARVFNGKQVTVSVIEMKPHTKAVIHSHENEQWGFLLEGEIVEVLDGKEHRMKAGDFWHIPPHVEHGGWTEEQGCVILDIFSPPRPGSLPDE